MMNPAAGVMSAGMMNPATGVMNPGAGMMNPATGMPMGLTAGMLAGMSGSLPSQASRAEDGPDALSSNPPKRRRRQQVATTKAGKKQGPVTIYAATWDAVVAWVSNQCQ